MPSSQAPIGSRFGAASTAEEVVAGIDLSGKTAIVTGGYAGIGLETVRVLAGAGAEVVVPVRDQAKAERALAGFERVSSAPMDLMDPASIDAFAETFLAFGRALDILVNNAGIMAPPLARDARGYESQFATNHLGHFQLTARLWPALKAAGAAGGARVVELSSRGHRFSPVMFDDVNFERRDYDPWLGYGQSKTANILFALELDRRGESHGVRAFSLHPGGIVATDLGRYLDPSRLRDMGAIDENGEPVIDPARSLKTIPQGAATSVWCAVSSELDGMGGVYCDDCDIAPVAPETTENASDPSTRLTTGVRAYAVDADAAKRLWTLSQHLTGLTWEAE
ncbi:oxidoreductase [Afifella marina]|uniref:Probable oxidoreductase n=1 Tax=Afifella marina DSM 2698 TaxID=1120955 RepID=A0A1G5MGC8_AFIMA|nr:oxidoreductase [Afifella marina]MBK1625371.1 oxidoreductase [Afifella marina DSM 2698]MBK1629014.1 oxidoreductase [Afifella marina]MBK5916914.1 oxidoreductase [Afifella marina]RAI22789.1 oxidoreductase [Afifella marina DSM 2698]SCZ24235.1 NAD(P)-dependent dehydrogenase, short-chain alcohol dehydrogenase family [Afifella marina DSM 2698]